MNRNSDTRPAPMRPRRLRAGALASAVAGIGVLAAACGGGTHPAGSGASNPPNIALAMNSYVHCMHAHGVPGLYVARAPHRPAPGTALLVFHGYAIEGASPSSPHFQLASKSCQHLLPHGTPPAAAELHQQFIQALKAARCMRAHGYPNWPDPQVVNGLIPNFVPSGTDAGSPQFQAARKACHP